MKNIHKTESSRQTEIAVNNWFHRARFGLILLIGLGIWLVSGLFTIDVQEVGIIRTFGRYERTVTRGLNYRFRFIQSLDIEDVTSIRILRVGYEDDLETGGKLPDPNEALIVTRDKNIIQVEFLVHYYIENAEDYILNTSDPTLILEASVKTALRSVVGNMDFEDVLTDQRNDVQSDVREMLLKLLENYETGIGIQEVFLELAEPPEGAYDAFLDVVVASQDRDRLIEEANEYANDRVPNAEGSKQRLIEEGMAHKVSAIEIANGETARFLLALEEYENYPEITIQRLRIEAFQEIFSNVNLVLLGEETGQIQDSTLPILPLNDN